MYKQLRCFFVESPIKSLFQPFCFLQAIIPGGTAEGRNTYLITQYINRNLLSLRLFLPGLSAQCRLNCQAQPEGG